MASYTWVTEDFIRSVFALFHNIPPPSEVLKSQGLLFQELITGLLAAPILETCVLIGIVELLRFLKSPGWLQVFLSTAILACLHAGGWGPRPLIVMPGFAIQAASYLWWRPASRKKAFAVVACMHFLLNLIPAIYDIAIASA